MANRKLSPDELTAVNLLLDEIRQRLDKFASNDLELLFAARRRLVVKLTHDERGTPATRNKLKALKMAEQNGLCPLCHKQLPPKYAELDRFNAADGYTPANTRLVHHDCHVADQARKKYL